jgi:hypothetical protein
VQVLRAMSDLLEGVRHVMFCAKDRSGAYLSVNQAFADRAGARSPDDVVGRRAEDLFDSELAASYSLQAFLASVSVDLRSSGSSGPSAC